MDHAEAYERSKERILDLVSDEVADAQVPTCPGWTVKDVVAHLASFFAVYKSGDPREAFSQGWGDRGVEERRERSLDECIAEWEEHLADPGDLWESPLASIAASDALAHEQDIRTALDRPGARNDENIVPAVERALAFVESQMESKDLPAFRVVTDEIDRQVGKGDPAATLRTSTFELFRTLHGRRTVEQATALDWEGDPGPFMPVLFIFGPAKETVEK